MSDSDLLRFLFFLPFVLCGKKKNLFAEHHLFHPQFVCRKQRIGRYAIKNIRERLLRKYQDGFTLEIQSEVGKGTTVILIVPYEEE